MTWVLDIDGNAVKLELVLALTYTPAGFTANGTTKVYEIAAHSLNRRVVIALRIGEQSARELITDIASSGARGGQAGIVRTRTPDALLQQYRTHADPF